MKRTRRRRRSSLWRALPAVLILAVVYVVLNDGERWATAVERFEIMVTVFR